VAVDRRSAPALAELHGIGARPRPSHRYRAPTPAQFIARLAGAPCCAAIVADRHLDAAIASRAPILFILRGNGLELGPVVRRIHEAGKLVAIHLDLVAGIRDDPVGIEWLARCEADAIITSHGRLIPRIRQERVVAIERLLLSRRSHLDAAVAALSRSSPDIVEVLPGVILPSIAPMIPRFAVPVLAGGFVRTPADARAILAAGAVGVTTSSQGLWEFDAG
jgi:glycerol uptake operon antiterminator